MKRFKSNLIFLVSAILSTASAQRTYSNPTESPRKLAKTGHTSIVPSDSKQILTLGQIEAYVRKQAVLDSVDPGEAWFIISHESEHGKKLRGDDGQSRGYWMISKRWHPEVSTACADDLACSTDWALHYIASGHINEWSTWRFRCQWYEDAPDCAGN